MAFAGRAGVTKIQYARLIAAALAHLISTQGDAVGLVTHDDGIRRYISSRTGQSHLRGVLAALSRMEAGGRTSTAPAFRRAVDLLGRRGLLLVISDLYDEDEAVEHELRRAVRIGHEVAVFHVVSRDELEFPFAGDVELEELETGQTILAGSSVAAAYRREFADFLERWRARCVRYRIDYTRILTDQPLDAALRGYLLRRAGSAAS